MKQLARLLPLNWRCGACGRRATYGHRCDHRDIKPEVEPLIVRNLAA